MRSTILALAAVLLTALPAAAQTDRSALLLEALTACESVGRGGESFEAVAERLGFTEPDDEALWLYRDDDEYSMRLQASSIGGGQMLRSCGASSGPPVEDFAYLRGQVATFAARRGLVAKPPWTTDQGGQVVEFSPEGSELPAIAVTTYPPSKDRRRGMTVVTYFWADRIS